MRLPRIPTRRQLCILLLNYTYIITYFWEIINLVPPEGMRAFTDLTAVLQTGELTRAQQRHMATRVGFEPTGRF